MSAPHNGTPGVGDPGEPGDPPAAEGLSGQELAQRAMGGSLWTAAHVVTSVPLAFLANAVVARILGVADYGTFAFLTIGFALAIQIANGGFSSSLIQWGAVAEVGGRRDEADSLLRRSMGFHVVVELPILLAAILLLAHDESALMLGALVVASVLTCTFGGASLALTIENRSATAAKLAMVSNLLVQLAAMGAALWAETPIAVFAARLLFAALLVPVQLLFIDPRRRRAVLRPRLPRAMPAGFWRFAGLSFVAGLLSALVFSRSEVFLLSWLSTPEAVGLFALAFGLSYQLTAPVDAMLNPLIPAVAGVVSSHPELVERAFLRACRFAALLTAMITAVLLPAVFFAVPLIYGEPYRETAHLLVPLALASCLQSLSQPVTAFVAARKQGGRLLASNAWALAANLALALALIGPFGVWGAVIANAVGQSVSIVVLARHELRTQAMALRTFLAGVRLWPLSCLAGLAAIGATSWASGHLPVPWLEILLGPLVGAVLLVGIARASRSGILADDRLSLLGAIPKPAKAPFGRFIQLFVIAGPRVSDVEEGS